ncbi:hypothetical protein [Phenylobacterium sp.]|uniref:hypothetical protein n=1 Tax=Phenylobacterium sp. TaxID=1871053 RepID=UPI0035AE0016
MRMRSKGGRARTLIRLALGGWVAFSALNAQAGTLEDVAAAFGNTVLATYPDGRHQRIWLHEDGAYEAVGRRGKPSSGRWSLKGDKVCLKQHRPFPAPISYCTHFPAQGDVGATWTGKDLAGVPIQLKLVKGVQRPANGPGS